MKAREVRISPADVVDVMRIIESKGTEFDLSGCLNVEFRVEDAEEDNCNSQLSVAFSKDGAKEMIKILQEFIEEVSE